MTTLLRDGGFALLSGWLGVLLTLVSVFVFLAWEIEQWSLLPA